MDKDNCGYIRRNNRIWIHALLMLFFSLDFVYAYSIGIVQEGKILVKGVVVDTNNVPLIGVSVIEKGTNNGTMTNMEGAFTITVQQAESVLSFSYLGYVGQEIKIGNRSKVNVTLLESMSELDEVVVVGYGTKRNGGGRLMGAIFRHELRNYFHSLTAYVFGAFLLAVVGLGSVLYNLQAAVSNFEFVLSFASIIFVVIVPILTMRTLAEERRQRTDQLLYSLPITTTQVVLGKYLALLVVYLIPLAVISLYPLLFSQFGDVYLPTSYGSLFAFFMMGAALLAVGMFLSSLTDNQGFAAGIGVAAILLNYYSVSLAEYTSSTAMGSLIALYVIALLLGVVIRGLTRNENLAYGVTFALIAALSVAYFVNSSAFEGLLPDIMTKLSLFRQFNSFVNGAFDLTAIVYYVSVMGFFLFLSVQSMEKRRYN